MVVNFFSDLKNKDVKLPKYTELAYDKNNMPMFRKIVPIKDRDRL